MEFVGGSTNRVEGAQMDLVADGFESLEKRDQFLIFEFLINMLCPIDSIHHYHPRIRSTNRRKASLFSAHQGH